MPKFDDFEVLSILGGTLSTACYKVRHKDSSKVKVFKVIPYVELPEKDREELLSKILKRTLFEGDNILKFHKYILHCETNLLYLITEYCSYGSLSDIIQKCIATNEYISEHFLWKILYQLTYNYKGMPEIQFSDINMKKIYVDISLNIKFYCFDINNVEENIDSINPIGKILHQLCSLTEQTQIGTNIPAFYTDNIKEVILYLLKTDTKQALDVILWHPTIIIKNSQKLSSSIFISKRNTETHHKDQFINLNAEDNIKIKLENLRNREIAIKVQEEKLKEVHYTLNKREKKVALMERIVKDKIAQAELYLKRTRARRHKHNSNPNYENINTSLSADCGDSVVIATSSRLYRDNVTKQKFSRAASERQLKFKGHSPLKAIHNINYNQKSKNTELIHLDTSSIAHSQIGSDKILDCDFEKSVQNTKIKKKFSLINMFGKKSTVKQVDYVVNKEDKEVGIQGLRPLSWTDENKRQAFDLLRLMNDQLSLTKNENIKHTEL